MTLPPQFKSDERAHALTLMRGYTLTSVSFALSRFDANEQALGGRLDGSSWHRKTGIKMALDLLDKAPTAIYLIAKKGEAT
ncbi:MAG: hypothetical protein Q8K91_02830 [Hylemonella sp.]|nr:hypothetical protein [Hylemonella sp.]MDP1936124.1 hypothetical protein [Hylemonella sp.]